MGLSVVDSLVGRCPEIECWKGTSGVPNALGQEDADQLLRGVDVPGGAVATVPAVPSRCGRQVIAASVDGNAEPPAIAVPESGEEISGGRRFLLRGDLVGHHELDRRARQDALVPELP